MGSTAILLSFLLALGASTSTTEVDEFSDRAKREDLGHLAYEMPEYPPHPDPDKARTVVVKPNIGRQAFGGYLLGSHRGEWGGELAFRHPDGSTEVLLHEPVVAIEEFAGKQLAFVGLAHLGLNHGAIYQVDVQDSGVVRADLFVELAGAPLYVGRAENGDVLFLIASGRFERDGLRATPVFDCYALREELLVRPASCESVRAAR